MFPARSCRLSVKLSSGVSSAVHTALNTFGVLALQDTSGWPNGARGWDKIIAPAFGETSALLASTPDGSDLSFPSFVVIDTIHPVQFPFQRDRAPASAGWTSAFPAGFLLRIKDSENEPAQETRDCSTRLLLLVTTPL